jgi:hypothetical protein
MWKKACYSVNQSLKNKIIQKEYQAKQKTIIEKIINQPHSIQREKNSIGEELQHINKSNQIVKKTWIEIYHLISIETTWIENWNKIPKNLIPSK